MEGTIEPSACLLNSGYDEVQVKNLKEIIDDNYQRKNNEADESHVFNSSGNIGSSARLENEHAKVMRKLYIFEEK